MEDTERMFDIPSKFAKVRLKDVVDVGNIREEIKIASREISKSRSLYIWSDSPMTGKTMAACALYNELVSQSFQELDKEEVINMFRNRGVPFVSCPSILFPSKSSYQLTDSYMKFQGKSEVLVELPYVQDPRQRIKLPIIVDDVILYSGSFQDDKKNSLKELLTTLDHGNRIVIITSRLSPEEFESYIEKEGYLTQNFQVVKIDTPNFMKPIQNKNGHAIPVNTHV